MSKLKTHNTENICIFYNSAVTCLFKIMDAFYRHRAVAEKADRAAYDALINYRICTSITKHSSVLNKTRTISLHVLTIFAWYKMQ